MTVMAVFAALLIIAWASRSQAAEAPGAQSQGGQSMQQSNQIKGNESSQKQNNAEWQPNNQSELSGQQTISGYISANRTFIGDNGVSYKLTGNQANQLQSRAGEKVQITGTVKESQNGRGSIDVTSFKPLGSSLGGNPSPGDYGVGASGVRGQGNHPETPTHGGD